jgi:hypothetical protein
MVEELQIAAKEVQKKKDLNQDATSESERLLSLQEQARGMFSERVGRARQRVQDALEGRSEKTWTAKSMDRGSQEWGQAVLDKGGRVNEAMKVEREQLNALQIIRDTMMKIPGIIGEVVTPYDLAEISI